MSTTTLPLWVDNGHFTTGLERHPRLAKRLRSLNEKIDACEDEDAYWDLVQERNEIFDKIVA